MTTECSSGRPPYKERQLRAPIRLCRTQTVLLAKPGMMVTYNHQPSDEPMQVGRNSKDSQQVCGQFPLSRLQHLRVRRENPSTENWMDLRLTGNCFGISW